jgi:hypothetical protein
MQDDILTVVMMTLYGGADNNTSMAVQVMTGLAGW